MDNSDVLNIKFSSDIDPNSIETWVRDTIRPLGIQVPIKRICDGCDVELDNFTELSSSPELSSSTYNSYTCSICSMRFDLCNACQEEHPEWGVVCPPDYGCVDNKSKTVYVKNTIRPSEDQYYLNATECIVDNPEVSRKRLGKLLDITGHSPAICVADRYNENKPIIALADLWIHFRSTETVGKYGMPLDPIMILNSIQFKQMYTDELKRLFQDFVDLDTEENSNNPLFLQIVDSPSGDFIVIQREYGEEKIRVGYDFTILYSISTTTATDVITTDATKTRLFMVYTKNPNEEELMKTN